MHLSSHDLQQLDEDKLRQMPPEQLRPLSIKLLTDVKALHDRLNLTPETSSQPPRTRAPWQKAQDGEAGTQDDEDSAAVGSCEEDACQGAQDKKGEQTEQKKPKQPGRPGRPVGAPGVSRTQVLPIHAERTHSPCACAICESKFFVEQRCYAARLEIDVVTVNQGQVGLWLQQTKHSYEEGLCACGHWTRAEPGRAPGEKDWKVSLTEWHLAGPMLVALICGLALRMRLSRARIQEFLRDWLSLELGVATINQCIHEAGRAVGPAVQEEIVQAVREAGLLHADETSWSEWGKLLWLWVFSCSTAVLFVVGQRTVDVVQGVLGKDFKGRLMSDGYGAYREFLERLRCWAHILRKAKALEQSLDRTAQAFGTEVLEMLETLMKAIYQARGSPPAVPLDQQHAPKLNEFFKVCALQANSTHEKVRELARELLNDWNTFWIVLEHPELPLTNNEAERALRHWVIARYISHGTRTAQGTRAFSALISVIETCRKRDASPWKYIADTVSQRRKGLLAPRLPPVPA